MIDSRLNSTILGTKDSYILKLRKMGIFTIKDLLLYFPRTYVDEQEFTRINEMRTDQVNVVRGRIKSIFNKPTKTGKSMTRAIIEDETGEVPVMWFNQTHIKQMFYSGSEIILTGKLKYERGRSMLMSPKYEKPSEILLHTGRIVPVYHESEIITSKWLREKIHKIIKAAAYFEEYMPESILEKHSLMGIKDAILNVHFAKDEEHLKKARERLAFDELFFIQFKALKRKLLWQEKMSYEITNNSLDISAFLGILPFELTNAQIRVIDEIMIDLKKPYPMLRLVQGDVGAGKTVVAAAAVFAIKQMGRQSAIMAPTEILARQHYKGLVSLLSSFGFNIQLLTGSTSEGERKQILKQLSTGTCDLIIGTHALIQESVKFSNLGLAVVDEQHRFGVKQRETLKSHGAPHLLTLTATPIPRTMALTIYGDQDLSIIDELPPGRMKIVTRIVPEKKRSDAYFWVTDQIKKGRQVFVICPLVEESEVLEIKAATDEYERLKNEIFPEFQLALLHGRMKAQEKDEVMNRFGAGEIDILVSTSVVEVGIDVPNASIMIIEGAERFGLAQLHQFRGRVGRGEWQSYCFLFSDSNTSDALQRLSSMVKYNSGFDLAEIDLSLRGPGEVFGTKQSGIPDLKIASFSDIELLKKVREEAWKIVKEDVLLSGFSLLRQKIDEIGDKDFYET